MNRGVSFHLLCPVAGGYSWSVQGTAQRNIAVYPPIRNNYIHVTAFLAIFIEGFGRLDKFPQFNSKEWPLRGTGWGIMKSLKNSA